MLPVIFIRTLLSNIGRNSFLYTELCVYRSCHSFCMHFFSIGASNLNPMIDLFVDFYIGP